MRKSYSAILILLISTLNAYSQNIFDSYGNYRTALDVVEKAIETYGGRTAIEHPISFNTKGVIYNLGHYSIPEERHEVPLVENYFFFRNGKSLFSREITMYNNPYKNLALYFGDSLYTKDFFQSSIQKYGRNERNSRINDLVKSLPSKFLLFAYQNRRTFSILYNSDSLKIVTFNDLGSNQFKLYFDNFYHLTKIEEMKYNDVYGDYFTTTEFTDYKFYLNVLVPTFRTETEFSKIERKLEYTQFDNSPILDSSVYVLKPNFTIESTDNESPRAIVKEIIGKNLFLLKLNSLNNKVLVAEYTDHFDIYETPKGIKINKDIIAEISSINPAKTIKNIFVSHHHPDHAGGLRAYSDKNINVITTNKNVEFLARNASLPHTLSEVKEIESSSLSFEIVPVNGFKRFKDSLNESIVYEIENTDHTKEYLVFYFPKEKILFVGDLVSFPIGQRPPFSGERGKSLSNLIIIKKLKVDKIYTSWPLKGQKEFGTVDDLNVSLTKQ